MTKIYEASEKPIEGVTSMNLLTATKQHGQRNTHYIEEVEDMAIELMPLLHEDDMVLTLGAGNIVSVGEKLLIALADK